MALAITASPLLVEVVKANEVNNDINWEQIKKYNKNKLNQCLNYR